MEVDIKKGDWIYEVTYPHIHMYQIERIVEQDGKLFAEVLVGYYKDKNRLVALDSDYTDLNLKNLKLKTLAEVDRMFDRIKRKQDLVMEKRKNGMD